HRHKAKLLFGNIHLVIDTRLIGALVVVIIWHRFDWLGGCRFAQKPTTTIARMHQHLALARTRIVAAIVILSWVSRIRAAITDLRHAEGFAPMEEHVDELRVEWPDGQFEVGDEHALVAALVL